MRDSWLSFARGVILCWMRHYAVLAELMEFVKTGQSVIGYFGVQLLKRRSTQGKGQVAECAIC